MRRSEGGGRRAPKTGLRSKTKEISSPRDYFFRYQKVFRHLGRKYKSVGSGSSEKRECGKLCRRSGHSFENFSTFPHWRSQSFWLWVFGVLSCPSPGLYSRQSPYGLRVSGIQGPTLSTPMDSHIPAMVGGGAESPTLSREQRSIPNLKGDWCVALCNCLRKVAANTFPSVVTVFLNSSCRLFFWQFLYVWF